MFDRDSARRESPAQNLTRTGLAANHRERQLLYIISVLTYYIRYTLYCENILIIHTNCGIYAYEGCEKMQVWRYDYCTHDAGPLQVPVLPSTEAAATLSYTPAFAPTAVSSPAWSAKSALLGVPTWQACVNLQNQRPSDFMTQTANKICMRIAEARKADPAPPIAIPNTGWCFFD